MENSLSQSETNKTLANRLLSKTSWLENEIERRESELDNYEDCNEGEYSFAQGIIEGLEIALHHLKTY